MIRINLKSGEKTEVLECLDSASFRRTVPYFEDDPWEVKGYKELMRRGVNFLLTGDRQLPYPAIREIR